MTHVRSIVVAAEHLVAAVQCLYRHAEDDGLITAADNPARKADKPRALLQPTSRIARSAPPSSRRGSRPGRSFCRFARIWQTSRPAVASLAVQHAAPNDRICADPDLTRTGLVPIHIEALLARLARRWPLRCGTSAVIAFGSRASVRGGP
jgi:hypothetical protein